MALPFFGIGRKTNLFQPCGHCWIFQIYWHYSMEFPVEYKAESGSNQSVLSSCEGLFPWQRREELLSYGSVQFSRSVVSDSLRPHESQHARPSCPSPTPGVHSELKSTESVMPSSHLILCRPLLLLPPIPPSIRVFSNESTLRMRWPKHWSFSFSISPSSEHPGLIFFRN